MQLEIINLYYFSLQETDESYQKKIYLLLTHIRAYLQEEGITVVTSKSNIGNYQALELSLQDIGKLVFFQKDTNISKQLRYFPEMYCEIHIEKSYLENKEKLRKLIFLLSNIFEQFDHFDERYIFIEHHSAIEKLKANYSLYELRHHFKDINELGKNYDFEKIQSHLQDFLSHTTSNQSIVQVQMQFPETYTSLLLFCYLIFSLQKNNVTLQTEIQNLKNTDFSLHKWQANQQLFILRAEEKQRQIEMTLRIYTETFEQFVKIFL